MLEIISFIIGIALTIFLPIVFTWIPINILWRYFQNKKSKIKFSIADIPFLIMTLPFALIFIFYLSSIFYRFITFSPQSELSYYAQKYQGKYTENSVDFNGFRKFEYNIQSNKKYICDRTFADGPKIYQCTMWEYLKTNYYSMQSLLIFGYYLFFIAPILLLISWVASFLIRKIRK